jgi:endonuclease I/chitodextrinase
MKKLLLFGLITISSLMLAQIPTGYYDGTSGLTGAALKTKLSQIITNGHLDKGYSGLWTGYKTTDIDKNYENDGSILDMYSENPTGTDPYKFTVSTDQCGSYSIEGDCYNREHVVPQSLFSESSPMVSDIHFIRATDGKVNGMRSNYPFGTVSSPSFTSKNGSKLGPSTSTGYTATVFEPIDEFKGDIARMIFYFVTRYESKLSTFTSGGMLGNTAYPGLQTWEQNVLLAWAAQDPVSPAEINRNNAAYTFQGNRNPYIDHPEWVQAVWGTQIVDTEAPTAPTSLSVVSTTTASANLSWTAATDNVGVSYYQIFVNGVFKTNSSTTTATIGGLNQGTTYNFYVVAVDAAGNVSPQSNTASGTTLTDTVAPTAPTNLSVSSVGTNNIAISWTASTDNIAVDNYEIYVNGVLYGTSLTTSANIANLSPTTTYNIYVIAKDAAGNSSTQSNTVSAKTLAVGTTCGDEKFETIPASSSTYSTYNWTSNGISWTSEDSRTDLKLNNRAITIRNGLLTALSSPNGIGNLTVTTQQMYSGGAGTFNLLVNGNIVGSIPYGVGGSNGGPKTTTTVSNINISGDVEISLVNTVKDTRVMIDDMTWTCYAPALATNDLSSAKSSFRISPNPVKNGEIYISGIDDLSKVSNVQIFDFSGKIVKSISNPFKGTNKINLNNLSKGMYILRINNQTQKFIVE